jgi:methylated-DNA-[protein]-cysteine S-methyltransferase
MLAPSFPQILVPTGAAAATAPASAPLAPPNLRRIQSPLGRLLLTSDGSAITSLVIERSGTLPLEEAPEHGDDVLDRAAVQLTEYFAGSRRSFDVPVAARGTAFQLAVWQYLNSLPFGVIASYGEIGRSTGRQTAGRAVGGAVGANPVPILVPCHRVLAGNRRVTGYSGGNGIATKVWLLDHEGIEHRV